MNPTLAALHALGGSAAIPELVASKKQLTRVFDKYKVTPSARPALVALWRRVEGGGA
jgi:hypothetical protein